MIVRDLLKEILSKDVSLDDEVIVTIGSDARDKIASLLENDEQESVQNILENVTFGPTAIDPTDPDSEENKLWIVLDHIEEEG